MNIFQNLKKIFKNRMINFIYHSVITMKINNFISYVIFKKRKGDKMFIAHFQLLAMRCLSYLPNSTYLASAYISHCLFNAYQ